MALSAEEIRRRLTEIASGARAYNPFPAPLTEATLP